MRWVGWKRTTGSDETLDAPLARCASTKLHAVTGKVGGYADEGCGEAGKALCGTKVPADDPDVVLWWVSEFDAEAKKCLHCIDAVAKCE